MLESRWRAWRLAAILIFLAGLLACILLCTRVTTANAAARQLTVVIVAVITGWTAICLRVLLVQPLRVKAAHVRGILAGEETERSAILMSVGDKLFLPRSVTIRKVMVRTGETEETLSILDELAPRLPEPGTQLVLRTVRSYITGMGGCHE